MKTEQRVYDDNFRAMGTDVSIKIITDMYGLDADLRGKDVDFSQRAIQDVKNIFVKNEKIFSRFVPQSELSRINASLGKKINVSREMFEVLELCQKFHDISEGYFDPRIIGNLENIGYNKDFRSHNFNTNQEKNVEVENIAGKLADDLILDSKNKTVLVRKRIDTTGIAKGYTVDEAAEFLEQIGFSDFIVDAGGDMFAQGFNKTGEDWKIAIEGLENGKLMLALHNQGIATSGISRKKWTIGKNKFHHLINPKNPKDFSWDLKTVTVIKEKTVEADGRAKVLFLMGKVKGLDFANRHNIKALFLDNKNNVVLSEAIKDKVVYL